MNIDRHLVYKMLNMDTTHLNSDMDTRMGHEY